MCNVIYLDDMNYLLNTDQHIMVAIYINVKMTLETYTL